MRCSPVFRLFKHDYMLPLVLYIMAKMLVMKISRVASKWGTKRMEDGVEGDTPARARASSRVLLQ